LAVNATPSTAAVPTAVGTSMGDGRSMDLNLQKNA
jgi:hypothetical protein